VRCTRPSSSATWKSIAKADILVIKVVERPSIAKLTLRGNKDIKTDDLKKGLKQIGLSEGETFDRLALDNVQQELIRQYTTAASTTCR
jgi:outer membrane protein insertion porin family